MISNFFINRPIFATVVSVIIFLTGAIALRFLPIAQYPRITPPGVSISISYPGASAQVVADSVAAPIEQQVNGVEGMLYMSSQMGNDGTYSLSVTFDVGTDLKTALVMVQNRVALAMPQLPIQVQNQGITIRKKTPDILLIVNFYSPNGRYDDIYLSNLATIFVKDELLRVEGVSDINYQGQRDYSIRAWLDPQKLAACNMTAMDVASSIQNQNLDAPAGQIGQPPTIRGQSFQMPIDTLGRLSEPDQFGDIIVKVGLPPAPPKAATTSGPIRDASLSSPNPTTTTTTTTNYNTFNSGGSSSTSSTGTSTPSSTTTSVGTPPTLTPTTSTPGGATSTGGGSSTGGATSTGGGATGGGATTGGGASGSSSSGGMSSGTGGSGMNGSLGGQSMGRGPANPSVGIIRLRDVARIELGAQNYTQSCTFDGHPAVGLSVYQLPTANALDVAVAVRKKMEELKTRFPDDVQYEIGYDITPYIRESVTDVVVTLFEAVALVGLVVLIFLQNWRSVLIPMIAVPVAIVGTFSVMAALGFSLNNISLFGLVLAIGIVVDDAIVVVENVERWLAQGLAPREATYKAMAEVTGPIIAVALVLCAVFVPCAFISGITGQFFRQFAVTIAVSTLFSTINSLTLSPALAAILLKPHGARRDPLSWLLDMTLGWFFWLFNKTFNAGTAAYAWSVGWLMRLNAVVLIAYAALMALTWYVFQGAPTGFVPQQDQGRLIVSVQLPDSASLQRTMAVAKEVDRIARETPGVAHTVCYAGMSFLMQATSSNFASMFIVLDPFDERQKPELRDTAIMAKLRKAWGGEIKDAIVTVYGSSPIPGLGVAGGFKVMVEDRGGMGLPNLQRQTDDLIRKMKHDIDGLVGVTTQFRSNIPMLYLDIDRNKVQSLGVALNDVNQTLDMYLGSLYVNSYNDFGRHWQVTIQADGKYRDRIEDINLFKVRNMWGQMVPLGTLVQPREVGGPVGVTRYNLYAAAAITGNLQTGVISSGQAIKAIDQLSDQSLPISMKAEWTELMYMQIKAGNTAIYVFLLSVVSVFLALSALYESWSLPLAVILVVPLCLLCSALGVLITHRDVNIFVQIGLVVLVGLACKNAILIVEFAKQLCLEGKSCFDATKEASRLRLRPILMTSFAFIFGVLPMVFASGAGAEMRRSLGTAVFSGMLGVTLFGIFLTPVFFYVIHRLGESPMFATVAWRWGGSTVLGALLGFASGFLLGKVGVVRLFWGLTLGPCWGVAIVLLVLGVHRTLRSKAGDTVRIHPGNTG